MREGYKTFVAKRKLELGNFTDENASTFDTPILLRNFGSEFAERLTTKDIYFADSLSLFKTLIKNQTPCLQNTDGSFPQTNQFSLYNFLFNNNFDAHDALEDVLALRKILFSSKLELATQTITDNSYLVSASHAVQDLEYLDRRQMLMQSFKSNLSQCLKKNMTEKIAGSGLAFEDLKRVYSKYGKKGVIAILSKPPSCPLPPRAGVTTTMRILTTIVKYFEENVQH